MNSTLHLHESHPALLEQVGRLRSVDTDLLERLRHEVMTIPRGWQTEYGQYQSGGWATLSLMNSTGDPQDVMIRDCDPVETTLLQQMPFLRSLLRGLGLRYMWVRLARLGANSFLWEHRDYADLKGVERHRLHLPLVTNSSAFLVVGGNKVHLDAGQFWRLTPTFAHGVCNLFGPDRIHLIMDCYKDDRLVDFLADQQAPPVVDTSLGQEETHLETEFSRALRLARLGYISAAEQHMLRLFYQRQMPEGTVYDLLSQLHDSLGRIEAADEWRRLKGILLEQIERKEVSG
ncbi:hypothetical protein GCM10022223_60120 [Kineosporia mesophila]|uniref:Aspartyl/asparaginy/proline hydroxylase domain-containing protein n=1 Tax=Kineosporia mesophila TaxID=566012 RepID=A0ABP7AKB6_9ACTN|nr:aspartyl/asparaginyl beta-hydroxylase domain-containing protein [Kineosporia mesophila]MCD5352465.1 aspartyl/asparaginyl beta-hydroxylase domain-containing protein [Kineosporia mesophila]